MNSIYFINKTIRVYFLLISVSSKELIVLIL